MTIDGYLLGTCVLSLLSRPEGDPLLARVIARLNALREAIPLYMSSISWGEIEYGWRSGAPDRLRDADRALLTQFVPLLVTRRTGEAYAEIKAALFERYAPKAERGKKARVEQLVEPLSGHALGVQENDIWIAAQASERNLVLATGDRMRRIKTVVESIPSLRFEDWTQPWAPSTAIPSEPAR